MALRNALGAVALESTQAEILALEEGSRNAEGTVIIGNARQKFRDGFSGTLNAQPDPAAWDLTATEGAGHIIEQAGDAMSAQYLKISLSPFDESTGVRLASKMRFSFPFRIGYGVSLSQRIVGQEFLVGIAGCGTDGEIAYGSDFADVAMPSTVSITSNVATITLPLHPFVGGDRVLIAGAARHELNVGPVYVTVVDRNTITVPITATNGTYSATGGVVRYLDFFRGALNGAGLVFENTNAAQASFVTKRNGARQRYLNSTIATTAATAITSSPYSDPFIAASVQELATGMDEVSFRSFTADSNSGPSGIGKWGQGIPDEELEYKILIRARNFGRLTRPVARIETAAKAGTTTATFTTDVAHGLAVGDPISIYGVRDQAAFPTTAATVASVISDTSFTAVVGSATTATSAGGFVNLVEGGVALPGAIGQAVASIAAADGILTLTGNTTWTGLAIGESYQLHGLEPAVRAYEGAYRLVRASAATAELKPIGSTPAPAAIGTTTTGGGIIRRTDFRVHFVRVLDHTRHYTEIIGGRGNVADINNAVPVTIAGSATLTANPAQGTTGPAKAEDAAHATGDLGIPAMTVRGATTPAARTSAAGDYDILTSDAEGKLIVSLNSIPELSFQSPVTTLSTTAATAVKASAGAGIRNYVTDLSATNTSATAARLEVLDGATVLHTAIIQPGATYDKSFVTPLRGTAATAVNVQLAAAVTDVRVSVQGYAAL